MKEIEAEKELTKLRKRLLALPNQFDWSNYRKKPAKECREHIAKMPTTCENCCDIYHKDDLINYLNSGTMICKNCIEEYHRKNK